MLTTRVALVLFAASTLVSGVNADESELQVRVDALVQQVHLRFRYDESRMRERREAIGRVLTAWNEATEKGASATHANQVRLERWVDQAMRAAMPGGSGELPPPPGFDPSRPPETVAEVAPMAQPKPRVRAAAPDAAPEVAPAARQPRRVVRSTRPAPAAPPDPFADDQRASPNPLRGGARRDASRPVFRTASVTIDLPQLAAEVRGFNAAVRELQGVAMRLKDGDLAGLDRVVGELERLDERRRFLDLYLEGLTTGQLRELPASPSVEFAGELARRKTADWIRRTGPQHAAERRMLERLNDRLAGLVGEGADPF